MLPIIERNLNRVIRPADRDHVFSAFGLYPSAWKIRSQPLAQWAFSIAPSRSFAKVRFSWYPLYPHITVRITVDSARSIFIYEDTDTSNPDRKATTSYVHLLENGRIVSANRDRRAERSALLGPIPTIDGSLASKLAAVLDLPEPPGGSFGRAKNRSHSA